MSTGFRLLLLILLGFGAVWIYRFRAPELNLLLNPTRPVLGDPGGAPPTPGDRAWGRLEPPARTGWEHVSSSNWDPESWAPERLEAGETPIILMGTGVVMTLSIGALAAVLLNK